ncbi:hypothetical protein MEQU1_002193 [Malassezia equina]|uniref:Uncharacterized protein n=1 Tax=Malassezia equina TaxID=1381935 RepID=A0AAF0EBV1_9BASI|nr:hypothetical protein MEQU1_002193 [Malassezia equina]
MATVAASLVQRDARLEQVLHGVQNACAKLGSAQQQDIDQATAMLLSLADSPHIVDDTCYVLAHSHDDAVQFHMLGAILHAMHLLDAENNALQVQSLVDMREWLLHAAVDRMRAWLGGHTWPAYVRTRHLRVIVMLSQRAGCQHARADPSPLLSLGQHIADLLDADEACMAVGLGLASILAEERNADGSQAGGRLGLTSDEHLWCHALIEAKIWPLVLPPLWRVLHQTTEHVRQAAREQLPDGLMHLWLLAAQATTAVFSWRSVPVPMLAKDAELPSRTSEQLWTSVQQHNSASDTPTMTRRISLALSPFLCHSDVPPLMGIVARLATSIAQEAPAQSLAAHRVTQAMYEAFLHVATYELHPDDPSISGWTAQRAALLQQLHTHMEALAPRLSQADDRNVASLQHMTHAYTCILGGPSGRVLLEQAVEPETLLEALARVTATCFHVAFELVPVSDEIEVSTACEAALEESLGLWRRLLIALHGTDASAVVEYVSTHVVIPYQIGRLKAAALAAEHDDNELGEEQERDVDLYEEQLTVYAALARMCLGSTLASLAAAAPPAPTASTTPAVWEQWHWFALLTGHVLADPPSGEEVMVPEALQSAPPATHTALVELIHTFLALVQALAPRGPETPHPASPQTLASALWFTARWIPTYLMRQTGSHFDESFHEHVLDELVPCMATIAQAWRSDAEVLEALARVWDSLAHSPGAMRVWLSKPAVHALVQDTLSHLEALPETAQGPLVRALVRCIDAARDGPMAQAAQVREEYFPMVMHSAQARLEAAQHAPPATVAAALGLWQALAEASDPQTSGAVHVHLFSQLPAIVRLVHAQAQHTDVQMAALGAVIAMVRALPELESLVELLPRACEGVHGLLEAVHATLISLPRAQGLDATGEELLSLYLKLIHEWIQAGGAAPLEAASATSEARAMGLAALTRMLPMLNVDVLRVASVREGLSDTVHALLIVARESLLGAATNAAPELPPPFATDDARVNVIVPRGVDMSPLQAVLRAAVFVMASADTLTEAAASAVAQGLGLLAEALATLSPSSVSHSIQCSVDAVVCDLLQSLLLRPLHMSMLTPTLLAIRKISLGRVQAPALGGSATFLTYLAQRCATVTLPPMPPAEEARVRAAYMPTVEHILQQVLASVPPPPPSTASPALAARATLKDEMTAAVALNRLLRPFVLQARGTLVVR